MTDPADAPSPPRRHTLRVLAAVAAVALVVLVAAVMVVWLRTDKSVARRVEES